MSEISCLDGAGNAYVACFHVESAAESWKSDGKTWLNIFISEEIHSISTKALREIMAIYVRFQTIPLSNSVIV